MTHIIIPERCIRDGACAEVCPVDCIVEGQPEPEWPSYYIDPDNCIDCGDCVAGCPVDAIYPINLLPDHLEDAITQNASFFSHGPGYSARQEAG